MATLRAVLATLRRSLAELLVSATLIIGWLLVTLALARATKHGDVVWPGSLGLLCLSASGWRLLLVLARDGLYTLTKGDPHG